MAVATKPRTIFSELANIQHNFEDIDEKSIIEYIKSLKKHVGYVYQAGLRLKVPEDQLKIHDLSKLSPDEFEGYVRYFNGDKDEQKFAYAWLHHIRNNPHHWQYWRFPYEYSLEGSDVINNALPMPEHYVREMVADWMGASKAYQNTWDMTKWLDQNLPDILPNLHPITKQYLDKILKELGYIQFKIL
jgi:hypothetical protein